MGQPPVQSAQQRSAACEGDASVHEVGYQLRRRDFDRGTHGLDDGADGARERVSQLNRAHLDRLRQAGGQIAPAQLDRLLFLQREGGAGLDLDLLRHPLADEHVVHVAGVGDHLLVHFVACDADGGADDDASQGDHGHLGRPAADVYDHAAVRLHHRQPGADSGCHRLLHQEGGAGAGVERGVVHRPLLHLRYAAGDADHHARARDAEAEAIVDGADEVMEHALRYLKVRDDAVFQRADGDDVGRRPAHHALRLRADGEDLLGDLVDGDDGRLVDDDAAAAYHHQGVRRPQVDADVVGEDTEEGVERVIHGASLQLRGGSTSGPCEAIIPEWRSPVKGVTEKAGFCVSKTRSTVVEALKLSLPHAGAATLRTPRRSGSPFRTAGPS